MPKRTHNTPSNEPFESQTGDSRFDPWQDHADDGDDDDASAVDRAVLGFGAVMASTGEAFFLRAANRATTRARLEKIFAKCRVVT